MEQPDASVVDRKRPRSPSSSATPSQAPAAKSAKANPPGSNTNTNTHTNTNATTSNSNSSMSINYLARHSPHDLPLIDPSYSTLPALLSLLGNYTTILDRHESLASNLGARPLGPILIKRFERCFDAPPLVVASHHKGAGSAAPATNEDVARSGSVSWMEVIEFARSHSSQFTLSSFSEGRRVCQFYYPTKQVRVQISEEDFLFINSGRCQELIPPLPIWEDEEKEVATCEVLEERLKEVTQLADMVAARTRQVGHRLKGRRQAVAGRRKEGGGGTPAKVPGGAGGGFVAVNGSGGGETSNNGNGGISVTSSAAIRGELLKHFESLPHNQQQARPTSRHLSNHATTEVASQPARNFESTTTALPSNNNASSNQPQPTTGSGAGGPPSTASSLSPAPPNLFPDPAPSTTTPNPKPANSNSNLKHNFSRPLPQALESSQPFRPLCQSHMDSLTRGTRVMPPCDRCRRLRMDCVKNLTSCAGCTKKHARCHWRDVGREEVEELDRLMNGGEGGESIFEDGGENGDGGGEGNGYGGSRDFYGQGDRRGGFGEDDAFLRSLDAGDDDDEDDDSNPLEDLDKIGEQEEVLVELVEDEEGLRNARELSRAARALVEEDEGGDGRVENVEMKEVGAVEDGPDGRLHQSGEEKNAVDGSSLNQANAMNHVTNGSDTRYGDAGPATSPSRTQHAHGSNAPLFAKATSPAPVHGAADEGGISGSAGAATVAPATMSTSGFRAVNG